MESIMRFLTWINHVPSIARSDDAIVNRLRNILLVNSTIGFYHGHKSVNKIQIKLCTYSFDFV